MHPFRANLTHFSLQWSDCSSPGGFAAVYTREELLTNVMIYWVSHGARLVLQTSISHAV